MKAPYTSIVHIVDFLYSIPALNKTIPLQLCYLTDSPYILTNFCCFPIESSWAIVMARLHIRRVCRVERRFPAFERQNITNARCHFNS